MTFILVFALVVLSVPVGFLIAWLARDELVQGRKWFRILVILSIISGISLFLFDAVAAALTCTFIALVSLVSYWKSFDMQWIRKGFKY